MFRSLAHGKRVVNGLSGFVPVALRDLALLLTVPGDPLSSEGAGGAPGGIHPLRYLVVRLADHRLVRAWQPTWHRLRKAPSTVAAISRHLWAYYLYEILPTPEQGRVVERWVSYDFLVTHPVLEATVRPLGHEPGRGDWVDVALNGHPLTRMSLDGPRELRLRLRSPFRRAAPNVIRFTYGYDLVDPVVAGREVGTTGVRGLVDLVVTSAGQPNGDVASILVNTVERAPNRRGTTWSRLMRPVTSSEPKRSIPSRILMRRSGLRGGSTRCRPGPSWPARSRTRAPNGSTRGPSTHSRTLGVQGDLRGRYRESHGFVGVKGASVGSALEGMGARRVTLEVGKVRPTEFRAGGSLGIELTSFGLRGGRVDGSVPRARPVVMASCEPRGRPSERVPTPCGYGPTSVARAPAILAACARWSRAAPASPAATSCGASSRAATRCGFSTRPRGCSTTSSSGSGRRSRSGA